jgi:putative tricarboxylic transport membrane protein
MTNRGLQRGLGLGAIAAAAFLALVAIPGFVSSPSNVRNIVLSPLFWPYVLAGLTGLTGLGLLIAGQTMAEDGQKANEPISDFGAGLARLAAMAAIMVATMFLIPRIGMVWTAMLTFAATAFVVKTRHPRIALICAVALPLVLYGFFAHVAGVAIPQGLLVRLP